MTCGLIGRRLGHSYSPQIHRALADYDYKLWELEPEEHTIGATKVSCHFPLGVDEAQEG